MDKEEKLICSIMIMIGLMSFELFIHKIIYPKVRIIDKRQFIIAANESSKEAKDLANIICDDNDCSEKINNLINFIPKSGADIIFAGGTIFIDSGITIPSNVANTVFYRGSFYGISDNAILTIESNLKGSPKQERAKGE